MDRPYRGKQNEKISATKLGMYNRCPIQYEFRYIKGIKNPPNGLMLQGQVYHKCHATNFEQKIKTLKDMDLADIADAYVTFWDSEVINNPAFSRGEIQWDEDPEKVKKMGLSLVKQYHLEVAPEIIPKEVETYKLKDIIPNLKAEAYLDLIDVNDLIIDHKVVGRKGTQADADKDLQATMYLWITDKGEFEFHKIIRKKIPEIQKIKTIRTEEQKLRFISMVKKTFELIQTGIFVPRCDGWQCSEVFCGYWNICKARLV